MQIRGLARHESHCQVEAAATAIISTAATVRERVVDLCERTDEIPDVAGGLIVVPEFGAAMLLQDQNLSQIVGKGGYVLNTQLVDLVEVRDAERQRDRRKGEPAKLRTATPSKPTLPGGWED